MKALFFLIMFLAPLVSLKSQPLPSSVKAKLTVPVKAKATPPAKVKTVYVVKSNDRDGDGLTDEIDDCPDEKGSPKNNGCPEKKVSIPLPEMIEVAGGSFTMGSENGEFDEKPRHRITLSGFSMAKTETTVAQWRAFCNATGQAMPGAPGWGWNDNDPIVIVSWGDAVAYCDWLREKTGKSYRLPTEAEWEFAARGGINSNKYKYAGGDDLTIVGWIKGNSYSQVNACGLKRSNELGIFDMSGNVWEWCKDWYNETYYATSPSTNPQGPSSGSIRVLRGGGWNSDASEASGCRVANRNNNAPADRYSDTGFRIVLSQ